MTLHEQASQPARGAAQRDGPHGTFDFGEIDAFHKVAECASLWRIIIPAPLRVHDSRIAAIAWAEKTKGRAKTSKKPTSSFSAIGNRRLIRRCSSSPIFTATSSAQTSTARCKNRTSSPTRTSTRRTRFAFCARHSPILGSCTRARRRRSRRHRQFGQEEWRREPAPAPAPALHAIISGRVLWKLYKLLALHAGESLWDFRSAALGALEHWSGSR